MGRFAASLKTLGDRRGMPATIDLEGGRISIALGEHPIGDWSLDEVRLEPVPNGYRMTAEGEQIFLEMRDSEQFASELHSKPSRFKGRSERRASKPGESERKARRKKSGRSSVSEPTPESPLASAETTPVTTEPARKTAPLTGSQTPTRESLLVRASALLDGMIDSAEGRWGALLPQWVFRRSTFFALTAILVLAVVFPGYSTLILLAAGLIAVTLGAVLYSDSILAAKWLPGRMTPKHVLLSGISVLVFGVLLGVIAT